jgi:3',5'-cyclic AMP phosphodiesterase CpdA
VRLHILSDLHLEVDPSFRLPDTNADVLVLAGDIGCGTGGMSAFAGLGKPVIYVPGNHEYYDAELEAMAQRMASFARDAGILLLDRSEAILNGVRFLGTTLWTDFLLDGPAAVPRALDAVLKFVLDFRTIRYGSTARWLIPEDTINMHKEAIRWLEQKLVGSFSGPTVVVTHHAPHPASVHPRWRGNPINPAFVSDLSRLMGKAQLWIHGHTHDSFDYLAGATRVVCNPKGYQDENRAFRADLVFEV